MLFAAAVFLVVMGMAWQMPGTAAASEEKNSQPVAAPTFYKDVLPILQDKCQSCHRTGEPAPMPLVTYEQTRPWAGKIAAEVDMKMMPPWFADPRYGKFSNDPSLSAEQIATIGAWANTDRKSTRLNSSHLV